MDICDEEPRTLSIVLIFFLILLKTSNEYLQSMFWSKNKKIGIPLHTLVLLYKSGGIRFIIPYKYSLAECGF